MALIKTVHPITGKEKIKRLDSALFAESDQDHSNAVDEVLLTPKNSRSIMKISATKSPHVDFDGDFNDSIVSKAPQDVSFRFYNVFDSPKAV